VYYSRIDAPVTIKIPAVGLLPRKAQSILIEDFTDLANRQLPAIAGISLDKMDVMPDSD
jgi:hypothetical protein